MALPKGKLFEEPAEDINRHLRLAVEHSKQKFLEAAQAFYADGKRSENQCLNLTNAIIQAIDEVLAAGDWNKSLFLKSTIKPLNRLREEAMNVRSEMLNEQGSEAIPEYQLKANEIKIYISLYQAEGLDLHKWALQLSSIDRYVMGRPIYRHESEVKKIIRQKLAQHSEAYAVIAIDPNKILMQEFVAAKLDRQGFELLTLQVGAVDESRVVEFVHMGKRYHFNNRRLILKG